MNDGLWQLSIVNHHTVAYSLESTTSFLTFEFELDFWSFLNHCIDKIFVVIVFFIANYIQLLWNFAAPIYLDVKIALWIPFLFVHRFLFFFLSFVQVFVCSSFCCFCASGCDFTIKLNHTLCIHFGSPFSSVWVPPKYLGICDGSTCSSIFGSHFFESCLKIKILPNVYSSKKRLTILNTIANTFGTVHKL